MVTIRVVPPNSIKVSYSGNIRPCFYRSDRNAIEVFEHCGDVNQFYSNLSPVPSEQLGIFVRYNSDPGSARTWIATSALVIALFLAELWYWNLLVSSNPLSNIRTTLSSRPYRYLDSQFARDGDHSPHTISESIDLMDQQQITQEIQLVGTSLDDRLNWIVGAYFFMI